jgi:hypothetical protein
MPTTFSVEILCRSSIPDNIINLRVFNHDQHIINVLHLEGTFKDSIINKGQYDQIMNIGITDQAQQSYQPSLANNIPKNVVKLEKIYDLLDMFKRETNYKTNKSSIQFEVVNMGTSNTSQITNLGNNSFLNERQYVIKLFKEYKDIFY